MFGRNSIYGGVKWLGVPNFLRNDGPPWTLNIMAPGANWGDRGYSTSPKWCSGSRGHSGVVSIQWNYPACVLPIYHRGVFENTRSAVCCACEICIYCTKNPSTCCNSIRGPLVNRGYDALDNRWDFSLCQ